MSSFPALRIEGGLLGPDLPEKLLAAELPGQKPADFGLDSRRSLTDQLPVLFAEARAHWDRFRARLDRLSPDEPATTLTRETWILPLFRLLGYELRLNPRAFEIDGLTFAVSHRAGEPEDAPPVHIVGYRQDLGRVAPSGRPRLSPHALVQEFLNRTDRLWGIVTNGRTLRLLRDSTYIRRQAYVDFDLEQIFEEARFQDFVLLFRLLHRSRLPRTTADAPQCWLEQYYRHSVEQGDRVRDRLRDSVQECLKVLANGFLRHPANHQLRHSVTPTPTNPSAGPENLHHELLRLVYRLLFLLVCEERGLLSQDPLYRQHYSISRLRKLVDHRAAFTDHEDLWQSLRLLWRLLRDDKPQQSLQGRPLASLLGLPVLNGELFEPLRLDDLRLSNRDLLEALSHLFYYRETPQSPPRRVNYAALDVEELGSVYESLLDLQPFVDLSGPRPEFDFAAGTERKSTGSYYTPPELVAELIKTTLEPVLQQRLKSAPTPQARQQAILSLRICDPACGSGHFLLAAARRLGKELARLRTGEDEPAPERIREATREVVAHCIYGVDKNPLAVELCRVALWLETHCEGKPLGFLDHRIRCGDSLVGVFDLQALQQGIPDDAYQPASTDDKQHAARLKARNRSERRDLEQGQLTLRLDPLSEVRNLSAEARRLDRIAEDSPEQIHQKQQSFQQLLRKADPDRKACHLWTAAFFQPLRPDIPAITSETVADYLQGRPLDARLLGFADKTATLHRFFHWPVEFPEVFAEGGFDVVLGNPPWEQIQLEEQEFFATRDRRIAEAPNAAERKRRIQELPKTNPPLWQEYQEALRAAESASRFLRGSGQYPLTGRRRINTYSVFAERMRALLRQGGRAGIIVPTGIATDDTNKHFFADLADRRELASLFDFENREGVFPHVHRSYKFCLLTMRRGNGASASAGASLAFFCTRAEHLRDPQRVFTLSPADIARLNPNTLTLPVFRTRQDAELTKAIYARVPVLVNERTGENSWGVRFLAMFHMSNDSHLFRTRADLQGRGFRLAGNRFVKGSEVYLPLYEAKMIWHYDHRYGTYEGVSSRSSTELPKPSTARHTDPAFLAQPWYWVPAEEVQARLGDWKRGWLLGFRDVARSTDERTAIFSLLPRVGANHKTPLMLVEGASTPALLVANLCSLTFDFVVRQKIGGTSLGFFILRQLPVLPPSAYTPEDLLFIVPRVLELAYTAWDLKPFADDVWREEDEPLREAIRRQWEENAAATGGHRWEVPAWAAACPEIETDPGRGIPLPPFVWHEERRARLRAELDACYARLYGLTRKQLRYILDPADLTERELEDILDPWEEVEDPLDADGYRARRTASTFPGETFRVLREKELRQFGEYRTRRLVLEAWQRSPNPSGPRS